MGQSIVSISCNVYVCVPARHAGVGLRLHNRQSLGRPPNRRQRPRLRRLAAWPWYGCQSALPNISFHYYYII
jgi:hypothetical protein